ncbi:phosphatidylinositol-4- kinase [Chytriomyces hyalinus]|nr:phosphatidylinositol-4- kinase [Chytriomyces hyalinus]
MSMNIVSEAAKAAALLAIHDPSSKKQVVEEMQSLFLNVSDFDSWKKESLQLSYMDQEGIMAEVDFAMLLKDAPMDKVPAVEFSIRLISDMDALLNCADQEPLEFPKFVYSIVGRILSIADANESISARLLEHVWSSVVKLMSLLKSADNSAKFHSFFYAFATAILESRASLHKSFASKLLPQASKTLSELIPSELSNESTLQALLDQSLLISEIYKLVAFVLAGSVLPNPSVKMDGQAAWDSLLQGVAATNSAIDANELNAFCTDSARNWTILSVLFNSEYYEIVESILPYLLRSWGLTCISDGTRSKDVSFQINDFLETVSDEHLEYDIPRTELVVTAIELLGLVAFNEQTVAAENLERLIQFILSPTLHSGANPHANVAVAKKSAIAMVQKTLTLQGNAAITRSTLFTFVNALQSSAAGSNAILLHESCVAAITGFVPVLSEKQVVEAAIPAIIRRIEIGGEGSSIASMWEALELLGVTGTDQVFEEVFPFLLKSILKGDKLKFEIKLAAKCTNLQRFLEKLLEAFVERVSILPLNLDIGQDKGLLNIATIIKSLCDLTHFDPQNQCDESAVLLFRNFWLVVTAFVFAPRAEWPKEWSLIVQSIALKTPTLALGKSVRSLDVDLVSNSVLRLKISEQIYMKVKNSLVSALFSRASEAKSVAGPTATFLLAVLQIESLRIAKGSLSYFLQYIRDERYYDSDVFNMLSAIGEEILFVYTKGKQVGKLSIHRSFKALLQCGSDRLPRVRMFAQGCCVRLLNSVPALLWDKGLICYMLDIVLFLDSKKLVLDDRWAILRNKVEFDLHFADETEQLAAAKDYRTLCANMLTLALGHSLSETTLTLQGYLLDLQVNYPDLLGDHSDVIALLSQFCAKEDVANDVIKSLNARAKYIGEVKGMMLVLSQMKSPLNASEILKNEITSVSTEKGVHHFIQNINPVLQRCAAYVVTQAKVDEELVRLICWTPLAIFDSSCIEMAIPVWNYVMSARPDMNARVLHELMAVWKSTMDNEQGLYEKKTKSNDPFMNKMTYAPSQKVTHVEEPAWVHGRWLEFLCAKFRSSLWHKKEHVKIFAKFVQLAVTKLQLLQVTSSLRKSVFAFLDLAVLVVNELDYQNDGLWLFSVESLFTLAFRWFGASPMWSPCHENDLKTLTSVKAAIKAINPEKANALLSKQPERINSSFKVFKKDLADVKNLLMLLFENEANRNSLWASQAEKGGEGLSALKEVKWGYYVKVAWFIDPTVALTFPTRFLGYSEAIEAELATLVVQYALYAVNNSNGILPLLKLKSDRYANEQRFLMYWGAVSPISAISFLSPEYNHPWILQYAFRILEFHPVDQVFFYIPQMVQALRNDDAGYVELFILKTAKISQLFAHQIIWNMNANMFITVKVKKHEELLIPDPLKPKLDSIIEKITSALSGSDLEFYKREFKFFAEVTGISGKLKPFIKKSKPEKKKKIDEEMRNIDLEVGVYLPSNPESIVVDIDRDSGRPLQSHAKAPFMATFKIESAEEDGQDEKQSKAAWQSAIFKVGDDCRQDVLALQLISIFKSIMEKSGLDVYVFPYRVVATDCGCGVIEVIPRSISRDMMGREKINSLPDYFAETFGSKDSFAFKKAQESFVRSLAAYSVILYLIAIKDRHNGNIMFDNEGHTVHIDFGFILDIAPGGIEFEASPFKLTTEFITVMGGDTSANYKMFSDLVVKSFLALRPFAEEIVQMVSLMLESGLPCFKGESTITKLRNRFQLDLDDKKAAEFMLQQIQKSHENKFSRLYDRFQNIQNGIPF